jgi:DNA repair exonuclease SbcCD nuclease subunit
MSKIDLVAFADLHLSNSSGAGLVDKKGINSFLYIKEAVFTEIIEYTVKIGCNVLLSAGDLIDSPSLDPATAAVLHRCIRLMIKKNIFFITIKGNHEGDGIRDMMGSYSDLKLDNMFFVSKPQMLSICGISFYCVPYSGKDVNHQYNLITGFISQAANDVNKKKVLVLHYPIVGCKYDSGMKVVSGFNLKQLLLDNGNPFSHILAGDFHDRQRLKGVDNFLYLGQPYWGDFSSIDKKRGFSTFDLINNRSKLIIPKKCPRFFQLDNVTKASDINVDMTNMIVKIMIDRDVDSAPIYNRCYELGAIKVIIKRKPKTSEDPDVVKYKYNVDKKSAIMTFASRITPGNLSVDDMARIGISVYMGIRKMREEI